MKIPRTLHFIWVTKDFENTRMPEIRYDYLDNVHNWMNGNKGFEMKLWTDNEVRDLVRYHFPDMEKILIEMKNPAMKADLIRLLILEKEGGVYLDMDVDMKKPLEPLLEKLDSHENLFVPGVKNRWAATKMTNWVVIGKPNLPVYEKFRQNVKKIASKKSFFSLFQPLEFLNVMEQGAAPQAYNKILKRSSMLDSKDAGNCGMCEIMTGNCENQGSIYFTHRYDSSWSNVNKQTEKIFCNCYNNLPVIVSFLLISLAILFSKFMKRRK